MTLSREQLKGDIQKNKSKWHVSCKADGERCFLHIGWFNDADPKPFSVLVNRRGEVFPLRLKVGDPKLF